MPSDAVAIDLYNQGSLPGHSIDRDGMHVAARIGLGARLYIARRKAAMAVLAIAASASVAAAVGYGAWSAHGWMPEADLPRNESDGVTSVDTQTMETARLDTQAVRIVAEADTALSRVNEAAEQGASERLLAERRRSFVEEQILSGNLEEAENIVRSITGIADELESRRANSSPLLQAKELDTPAAPMVSPSTSFFPAGGSLEAAFGAIEEKVATLESFLASSVSTKADESLAIPLEFRIAGGKDQPSAFWRRSESGEQQYFAIVEAVTEDGRPHAWPIKDMDTDEEWQLERWAQRVTQAEYARIAAEKAMGHTLPDPVAGTKAAGEADIDWKIGTESGALAEWKEDDS